MPAVRERIEAAWGARCFDHAGASEVGSFAYPCAADGGLHLFEDEFVCEILDPATGEPVARGRHRRAGDHGARPPGFPVIRYRTGDMIARSSAPCSAGHPGMWLPQGILGRVDDMVVIRGMNVFPSAIEEILRRTRGVGEFAITFYNDANAMDEVKVEVELDQAREAREIQERLRQSLGLRVRIVPVKPGILPTYTGKARRVQDLRTRSPHGAAWPLTRRAQRGGRRRDPHLDVQPRALARRPARPRGGPGAAVRREPADAARGAAAALQRAPDPRVEGAGRRHLRRRHARGGDRPERDRVGREHAVGRQHRARRADRDADAAGDPAGRARRAAGDRGRRRALGAVLDEAGDSTQGDAFRGLDRACTG